MKGKASCPDTAESRLAPLLLQGPAVCGKPERRSPRHPALGRAEGQASPRRLSPGGRARGRAAERARILGCSACSYVRSWPWWCRMAAKRLIITQEIALAPAHSGPRRGFCVGQRMLLLAPTTGPALPVSWAHKACAWGMSSSARREGFERMTCSILSQSSWDLTSVTNPAHLSPT